MGVIIPGYMYFKMVHTKRYFALNVFVLTRFHCTSFCNTYLPQDHSLLHIIYKLFTHGVYNA